MRFIASLAALALSAICTPSYAQWSANTFTGNHTIAPTDCYSTVQMGSGSTGQLTVTLSASLSGFTGPCPVKIVNGDTGRGKVLSGFGGFALVSPDMLWPQRSFEIQILNGAWAVTDPDGRWPIQNARLFIDTSGNDANDGLATGSSALRTLGKCVQVAEQYIDTRSNGNGGVKCSPTAGQAWQEFVQVFFPLVGGGTVMFEGNGGQFTWKPANNGYALQFGDLGVAGITNVLFDAAGVSNPQGYVLGHNYGILDVNGSVSATTSAIPGSIFDCDFESHFNINNGFQVINSVNAMGGYLYKGCPRSVWNINGTHTFTTNPSIGRFAWAPGGALMQFQGNVSFSGSASVGTSLLGSGGVMFNYSGATLPGGTPTPTSGAQYCTSPTC